MKKRPSSPASGKSPPRARPCPSLTDGAGDPPPGPARQAFGPGPSGKDGTAEPSLSGRGIPASPRTDEASLRAYFRGLARAAPPPPLGRRRPEPKERAWPLPVVPPDAPDARIVSCHPAFAARFPEAPVRPIGRSSRSALRGRQTRFPSLKSCRHMRLRSRLEYRHAMLCELDGDVAWFCEEPVVIRYRLGDRLATHRVDAYVQTKLSCDFVELKYEDDAASAENEARWPWIARAVNALGLGYRVLTERHVIDSLRAETALAVFERRMTRLPELTRIRAIVDAVTERGSVSAGDLVAAFADCLDLNTVFALARHGHLAVDLDAAAGPGMGVRRGAGPFRRIGLAAGGDRS